MSQGSAQGKRSFIRTKNLNMKQKKNKKKPKNRLSKQLKINT